MERFYTYSLLTYKHSILLGESLNIGVLIYFESESRFVFKFSKRLNRIKSIYPNVSDRTIKHYLKQILNRINKINNKNDDFLELEIKSSFSSFLNDYILPIDGSSLQFIKTNRNYQLNRSNIDVVNYLTQLYLLDDDETQNPNKEYELTRRFYNNLKSQVKNINNSLFYKDYKVKRKSGAEFTFSYAWKNGSLNLIKPLNFDLTDANYIAKKTNENYGLIVGLENEAEINDFRYDLFVGRPQKKVLFKEYDNSIKFLSELSRVKIIEENEIDKYSSYAAIQLSKN